MTLRREALVIKPAPGKTYAEVLSEVRSKVNPEDTEMEIKSSRKTRCGGVLFELAKNDKGAFREAVSSALGELAVVSLIEPKVTIEIRDLDCLLDEQEVRGCLTRDIPDLGEIKINLTSVNPRGQKLAIIEMKEREGLKLLTQQKIRIGWVLCRIRKRTVVSRCFRCMGYGHLTRNCTGTDRSSRCYKFGGAGHKAKTCTAPERCILCAETLNDEEAISHKPGAGRCRVFREELIKARATDK